MTSSQRRGLAFHGAPCEAADCLSATPPPLSTFLSRRHGSLRKERGVMRAPLQTRAERVRKLQGHCSGQRPVSRMVRNAPAAPRPSASSECAMPSLRGNQASARARFHAASRLRAQRAFGTQRARRPAAARNALCHATCPPPRGCGNALWHSAFTATFSGIVCRRYHTWNPRFAARAVGAGWLATLPPTLGSWHTFIATREAETSPPGSSWLPLIDTQPLAQWSLTEL